VRGLRSNAPLPPLLRTLVIAASAVVILAGMSAASNILNAFLLAVLIATVCVPFENWLQHKGTRPLLAFVVTLLISILIGIGAALFLALSILQVIQELPKYQAQLQNYLNILTTQLEALGFSANTLAEAAISSSDQVIQVSLGILRSVVGALGTVGLMYFFLFYMLMDGNRIAERLHRKLGHEDSFVARAARFTTNARRYLILRTIIGAGIATIQTVLMLVMGVDFALLWGALSFICNYIPNIGFVIGLIPPAILIFLEQGPGPTIVFMILYLVINNIVENYIAPKFIGVQVNLSPLSVTLSLVFWTWILGPLGAILGLPITLFIKGVLLEGDSSADPLIALMSEGSGQESAYDPILIEDSRAVKP
jgi:predicted PurR-regulated permease PerM